MNGSPDPNKANRERFGTLMLYMAPMISLSMFVATVWIDWFI